MAKGYIVFTEAIHDQQAMDAYAAEAVPTLLAAGGRPFVAGPPSDVLEGEWHGDTTVMIEFESVEAARAWYDGDAYQAVIGQRHAAANTNAAIFSEFELPGS